MENENLMLFICISAPLSMMLFVFRGRSRAILGFLLSGIFMCLFAGEINGLILNNTDLSVRFLTVNVTPIVEEMLKAIPIVFTAFMMKPKRQHLLEYAIAVGVGFATLENVCLLADSADTFSTVFFLARGFGAGMMHGVSTLAVGYSLTVAGTDSRISHPGTVAALSTAVIYHSIYNIMVQSEYPALGVLLPVVTFIPLLIIMKKQIRGLERETAAAGKETV